MYRIHCRFYRKYTIIIRLQQYWLSKANSFANSVCKHNCKHKCLCKCKHLSESKAAKAAWHNSIKVHCKAAIYCELQCAVVVQKGSSKRRAAEYCEPHSAGSNAVALAASPKVSNRLGSSRAITCLHTAAQAGPPPPPDPSPRRQRTVSGLHLLHLQTASPASSGAIPEAAHQARAGLQPRWTRVRRMDRLQELCCCPSAILCKFETFRGRHA